MRDAQQGFVIQKVTEKHGKTEVRSCDLWLRSGGFGDLVVVMFVIGWEKDPPS